MVLYCIGAGAASPGSVYVVEPCGSGCSVCSGPSSCDTCETDALGTYSNNGDGTCSLTCNMGYQANGAGTECHLHLSSQAMAASDVEVFFQLRLQRGGS